MSSGDFDQGSVEIDLEKIRNSAVLSPTLQVDAAFEYTLDRSLLS